MKKFILAAISMAVAVQASTVDAEVEVKAETEIKATVSAEQAESYPVMRDPILSQTSINRSEVLVCTTRGCFAVHADLIDLDKVFVTKAKNGQSVLVPYANQVENGQESGALPMTEALELPSYVVRLVEFAQQNPIYDQPTYELRIRAEADIMVALEAVKTDIMIIRQKLITIKQAAGSQKQRVEQYLSRHKDSLQAVQDGSVSVYRRKQKVDGLFGECSKSEKTNQDHRRVLILYCQQFAFGTHMQNSCRDLLWCRQRQIAYGYGPFSGKLSGFQEHHEPVASDEHFYDETPIDAVSYEPDVSGSGYDQNFNPDFHNWNGQAEPVDYGMGSYDFLEQVSSGATDLGFEASAPTPSPPAYKEPEVITVCANCMGWTKDVNPWA